MKEELTFEAFPKMSRMKRECTITEKIDGTNAQICFSADGDLLVGSRKRQIWPEGTEGKPKGCDNYGFAKWVYDNRDELWEFLGEGRHFGEWCGCGIQRTYGLDEKLFLLFNTSLFGEGRQEIPRSLKSIGLGCVPIIYNGVFDTNKIDEVMAHLEKWGSDLGGFDNPEGIVVYHHALRKYFKITYEHDRTGKGDNR